MIIEHYLLLRSQTKDEGITFKLQPKDDERLTAIETQNRLIYIVRNENDYLYVGEAKKELKTRMARGFSAYRSFARTGKRKNGYAGYKWIKLFDSKFSKSNAVDSLSLTAIVFDNTYTDKREHVEAVEGELVHLIRVRTGKWPLYQNEIHFNNEHETADLIASEILDKLTTTS